MSMQALLVAVRERILSSLDYSEDQCGIQPDGEPIPMTGQHYVAVHPMNTTQRDEIAEAISEFFDIGVTVTMRIGWAPTDRQGEQIVAAHQNGLAARVEAIRAILHMDDVSRNRANELIGSEKNGFVEPLKFRYATPPMPKGANWFAGYDEGDPPAGLAVQMTFVNAHRIQRIESQS